MAALKQANPTRCTECGHPVSPEAAGTICSEYGEPVDKHRPSRLGAEDALALYAGSFAPVAVMAVVNGMPARRAAALGVRGIHALAEDKRERTQRNRRNDNQHDDEPELQASAGPTDPTELDSQRQGIDGNAQCRERARDR